MAIRSPFDAIAWAEIEMRDGAVCSSGDYARFVEIDGRRFGHIIDPRSGWPTEETRAVTVIGPDAATADAWATALSILGVEGLDLLRTRDDLEAMVVTGSPEDYRGDDHPRFPETDPASRLRSCGLSVPLASAPPISPIDRGLELGLDALGQLFVRRGVDVLLGRDADKHQ